MTSVLVHNLVAYSGQFAILVTAGGVLLRMLKLDAPARLRCLHLLLACCVLLPVAQPWRAPQSGTSVGVSTTTLTFVAPAVASSQWIPSLPDIILWIVAMGILVRLAILAASFFRLGRYLEHARFVPDAFPLEKERTGAWPDVFVSEELNGPVTFGFFRPVVLIPVRWRNNESVACHELLHVRRRDWALTVLEEIVRAMLWFHPAAWWLIGQIQLAREEAVDRAAVQLTQSREQYLKTLLAIAETRAGLDLASASLFLRKRHLRQRVAALLNEVNMSKIRVRSSLAGFVAVVAVSGWLVTRSFPLQAAPQSVKDAPGVSVQQDDTKLLHRAAVRYPKDALAKGIQGTVVVQATLNEKGEVSDAQVISGPQELRKAALESVLEWHYNREVQAASQVQIAIDFVPPAAKTPEQPAATPSLVAPASLTTIARIDLSGVPQPLRDSLAARLPVHEGDPMTVDTLPRIITVLADLDEHLRPTLMPTKGNVGAVLAIRLMTTQPEAEAASTPVIRVGGYIQANNLVTKVTPLYPPAAKEARIQGTVKFTAYISKDGHIQNLELVSGHPLLAAAAEEAVKQWVYRPTLLNGEPVEVVTQIDVNFTLSQ